MQKVIFRAQGNGSLSRPFILEVDHQFDKNSPFMVEIEANYEGFERVTNYFAFSNNSEVMLLSYLKLVDNHYIEHETEHALARTFIATDKNHIVDGPFAVSIYGGITYLSKMQLHDGVKIVNSEFIKIPKVSSLQEWVDKINKGIGIYIIDDLTEGIVYYTRGETRNFLSGPVIVEVIAIDEHSEPGKSYQYIRVRDTYGNEAIGYFDVEGLSDFVETASDPLVAAADYILPIVKREIIEGEVVAPYAEESGKTTYDDLDRKISDTYHAKKEDLIIEAASPDTPSPRIRMRARGETEVEEYNIQALTDGSLKVEKTDLNQAPFVIKSDGTVEIEKLESPLVDAKVDKPTGSPNNYFSESNEYLPLQRFARVRYQSTSGWAKVAEVTLPASADERKSAIFFINSENNTSTTSESYFGILEWNIHETPASNSIKWLVTYGFGENNFNIRYHSNTNTLSFFVLPTIGNMNLWLASESTNGHVTSDIVLFDATDSTSRTGLSVAAKADYLTHAGHVRNTRKVAGIALSGDISAEALINALKASGPNDTDKLTTVGIVADMFAELVNGAPAALDTLQELAQALGDDPNFATTITNLIGTKADKTYVDGIITTPLIEVTWQELKDLRDSSALVPGQQYRITDYVTTTVQEKTRSAGHQFDIIVVADDVNKLNENARAVQHEGDTYFANSKLEAWQLKYCLDNDTNRFAWADGQGGKGVIYRMIDEFNNDVPYDFKNIQYQIRPGFTYSQFGSDYSFTRDASLDMIIADIQYYGYTGDRNVSGWSSNTCWLRDDPATTSSVMYDDSGATINRGGTILAVSNEDYDAYTFSKTKTTAEDFDVSLNGSLYSCYDNIIRPYVETRRRVLNRIIFVGWYVQTSYPGLYCYDNTFGNDCHDSTFGDRCYGNTFGSGCHNNTFDTFCNYNTFGNNCNDNTFGYSCIYNTFGNSCSSNTFGSNSSSNTFGYSCSSNTFGSICSHNTFGIRCNFNTFGGACQSNTFGNDCWYLQISNASPTAKKYIHVEDGMKGNSSMNRVDLYDPAILDKDYQVTFSKDAAGNYIMKWHNTLLTYTGKYKTSNTDNVWKDITPVETYE